MIRVTALGHYFAPLEDDALLPPLQAALKEAGRGQYRRIDRFVELALLGAGRCAAGRKLAPDCGLYLGSGLGPMGDNVRVQQQLVLERFVPMPFNFINILGSNAGFYVAKDLGLSGQNYFVSRRGASFEAALELAVMDLELGVVRQALVGVVEDVSLPLAEHRLRQGLAPGTRLAEGSHWLLLETSAEEGCKLEYTRHPDAVSLQLALSTFPEVERRGAPTGPFHDSLTGAWVTERLRAGAPQGLIVTAGTGLFHFRP